MLRVIAALVLLVPLAVPLQAGSGELIPKSKVPQQVTPQALLRAILEGRPPLILDTRPAVHMTRGFIPGAYNVPHKQVPGRWDEIKPHDDRGVVVYCHKGLRTRYAARALQVEGLERVGILNGFLDRWQKLGYPLVRPTE